MAITMSPSSKDASPPARKVPRSTSEPPLTKRKHAEVVRTQSAQPELPNGHASTNGHTVTDPASVPLPASPKTNPKAAQAPASKSPRETPVTTAAIKSPQPSTSPKVNGTKTKASVTTAASPGNGNRVSKAWPASVDKPKIRGLDNPSQWCYRRSLQQALFCVPQFFNVLEKHTKHQNNNNCVSCALAQSVQSYQTGAGDLRRKVSNLDDVIKATGRRSDPSWRSVGHSQDDSHDFLQYLLGTAEKAAGIPKANFKNSFHVAHQSMWECQRCGKKHTHTDPASYSLSLPIFPPRGQPTLASCLDRFHREENLTIRCDGCQKNIPRTRIRRIQHAPEALFIHLMRFDYTTGPKKNSKFVDFPENLDLSKWCLDPKEAANYRLQAVVAHAGSLKFGHYKAYIRDADGQVKEANDETISKVSSNEWRKPRGFDPYILLYQKQ
ncbi:hypothetical protein MBLNU457_7111t1 [Dothideomycetes sp. NU457]